jgi:AdoMet-dependent heme synthase
MERVTRSATSAPRALDYSQRPMLVFWEVTRACLLACRHCRASATRDPLPGELDGDEGRALIDQVAAFGRPYPILVLTGGDCLLREDVFEMVAHADSLGVPVAMSPSVTPMLTPEAIARMAEAGVKAVSLSLDGATPATHDGVRGIPGHFEQTIPMIRALVAAGLKVQINTTVMSANLEELADIAALMAETGVAIWEVFFLVHVGRGEATGAITAAEHEDVCHFLYDASHYGFIVRTVEAPFFRRVLRERTADGTDAAATPRRAAGGLLYRELSETLAAQLGAPTTRVLAPTAATRDGKGIVFVAHNGDVHPSGFLPLTLGNVRDDGLLATYRDHPLLQDIRAANFAGRCGSCEYSDLCGGSRARAYAATGDALGDDPACLPVAAVARQ